MKQEVDNEAPLRGLNGAVPASPGWFKEAIAAPFEADFVEVDGLRIEYRAWGERGKPGLVLFHGNAAHLGWWSFLAPFFAADYRVVAPSFSGMGLSDWRDRTYTVDDFMREGFAAAEAGGACLTGPPIVIGHSLGGQPTMRAAATRPELLRAGVIVDSGFPGPEMIRVPPRSSHRTYPDLPSGLDRFRLSPPQPCENVYIADYLARMGLKQLEDGSWTWRFDPKLYGDLDTGDLWADFVAAKVPVAVIRGACSSLTGGGLGARLRSKAPPGTPFIDIPGAYHHVMVDQPLALVASLRTLLAAWN